MVIAASRFDHDLEQRPPKFSGRRKGTVVGIGDRHLLQAVTMRLDVFLKVSRLIPRRTLAQEFCEKGLISVNGQPAKSAKEVNPDDEIEIRRRGSVTTVRITATPERKQLSKSGAQEIFEVVATRQLPEADLLAS